LRTTALRIGGLLAALTAPAIACNHGVAAGSTPAPGMYALELNGKLVTVPTGHTVLDAIRRSATAAELFSLSALRRDPLFVIDHVRVTDGFSMFSRMPVCGAAAIELLRPLAAVTRFGSTAGSGAIVLSTRRGDTPARGC
jgi:hypothetical protein